MERNGDSEGGEEKIHHRDTEDTEIHRERELFIFGAGSAKNKKILCTLCASVLKNYPRVVRPSRTAYLTSSAKLLKPSFSMIWRR